MKLSFSANSRTKIPCTADSLVCDYKANGDDCSIEFDIQGCTHYSDSEVDACTEGEFIPWVFVNHTKCEEIDYYEEEGVRFSDEQIWDLVSKTEEFRLCLYPAPITELEESEMKEKLKNEAMWNCNATISLRVNGEIREKSFSFIPEFPSLDIIPALLSDGEVAENE